MRNQIQAGDPVIGILAPGRAILDGGDAAVGEDKAVPSHGVNPQESPEPQRLSRPEDGIVVTQTCSGVGTGFRKTSCSKNRLRRDGDSKKRHHALGRKREIEMDDRTVRATLERHWDASDAGDFAVEHEIYGEDAVLYYPQSGERIRGRRDIQESRFVQPNKKRFTVRRIIGSGDLWVTEFVLAYDGIPSYAVSIMEFCKGLVANETQYFADRFDPAPSRAHLVERVSEITSS
jgi:hypothetical protein